MKIRAKQTSHLCLIHLNQFLRKEIIDTYRYQLRTYIINGIFFLHRVMTQILIVLLLCYKYFSKNCITNMIDEFDGYNGNSKNIKAMEQLLLIKITPESADMLLIQRNSCQTT